MAIPVLQVNDVRGLEVSMGILVDVERTPDLVVEFRRLQKKDIQHANKNLFSISCTIYVCTNFKGRRTCKGPIQDVYEDGIDTASGLKRSSAS